MLREVKRWQVRRTGGVRPRRVACRVSAAVLRDRDGDGGRPRHGRREQRGSGDLLGELREGAGLRLGGARSAARPLLLSMNTTPIRPLVVARSSMSKSDRSPVQVVPEVQTWPR